jgi:GTP-binding protein Era
LLHPKYALQRAMRGAALEALRDADVIVYVADATDGVPDALHVAAGLNAPPTAPVLLALNKADRLRRTEREALERQLPDAYFISASKGEGVDALISAAGKKLPASEFLYPEDEISSQQTRFFVSELIRETALELLSDEVPYSIACEIEEFREERKPVYIRAVLHVERDSQKRILIGAKGAQIKSIGQSARKKIESLIGESVYLDLWTKVLPNWRKNVNALARFGYRVEDDKTK